MFSMSIPAWKWYLNVMLESMSSRVPPPISRSASMVSFMRLTYMSRASWTFLARVKLT